MKNIILYLTTISLIIMSSCISTANLESGKTLGKDNEKWEFQGTYFGINEGSDEILGDALPFAEVGYQRGITEKIDLGFSMNSSLTLGLDGKYQLTTEKTNTFQSSIGLGLQSNIGVLLSSEENRTNNLAVSSVSYNSYHFSPQLFTFVNPHYYWQSIFKEGELSNQFLGVSIGIGYQRNANEFVLGYTFDNISNKEDKSIGKIMQFGIKYSFLRERK